MSPRILPAIKGAITGLLMIGIVLAVYYSGQPSDSNIQYLIYAVYGVGIIWTLLAYRRSASFTGKFTDIFSQGFRCFIVVTLMMVLFTFVFNKMHPEFAEQSAASYKEHLLKQKDKLVPDIDKEVANAKKNYNTVLVYGAIFGYLIIGAGVTAVVSAILTRRT